MWKTNNQQSQLVTQESCIDVEPLLEDYIKKLPIDPELGNKERTYYAIKREHLNKKITVMSCASELSEQIKISK